MEFVLSDAMDSFGIDLRRSPGRCRSLRYAKPTGDGWIGKATMTKETLAAIQDGSLHPVVAMWKKQIELIRKIDRLIFRKHPYALAWYANFSRVLYWDKFGIETARVRIGSCFPEPRDHRMLATWLSPDDFVRLCEAVFRAPRLGCPVIYGASANAEQWWDNSSVGYVGWVPQDSSEGFRAKLDAAMAPPAVDDPANRFQGGGFAAAGHYED